MGKTLVVKGQVVGEYKYEGQNIENLILEEGLLYICQGAFRHNNIRKLYLPKSVKKVENRAFYFNPFTEVIFYNNGVEFEGYCFSVNLKKITIIDGDYKFLYNFINRKIDYADNFLNVNEINIVNDKLSFIEKLKIKYLASKYPEIKINILQDIDLDEFIRQETYVEDANDEINILLSNIHSMIYSLDGGTQQVINDKIKSLISEYQVKLENSKPQFSTENDSVLMIEDTSPKALRNKLIFSLEMIIQNLNTKDKIIKLSEKISQYLHYLLDDEINIDDDEIFLKIKEIINISKTMEETKYITELKELLWKIRKIIINNLNDEYVINLTLKNFDIEIYFKEELSKLYNEVMTLNSKLNPYLELLKALKGYENDILLAKELRELEQIFSKLIGKSKDGLTSEYQKLKEKYKNILNENILKIKNNQLDALSINEIELNFRKELQPILERLNELSPLILKNQKLYYQIIDAANFLNNREISEINPIADVIKEIKDLYFQGGLTTDIAEMIYNKIKEILYNWYNIFKHDDTSEIVKSFSSEVGLTSENLILEVMILKELYGLKFSVEQYIADLQEYDKAISNVGTISIDKSKSEIDKLREIKEKILSISPTAFSNESLVGELLNHPHLNIVKLTEIKERIQTCGSTAFGDDCLGEILKHHYLNIDFDQNHLKH